MRSIHEKKGLISTLLLLTFFLIIIIGATLSEFFQAPAKQNLVSNKKESLFRGSFIDNLEKITITNQLGSFTVSQSADGEQKWQMITPGTFVADQKSMATIVETLRSLKIIKTYTADAININNFALDKPVMTIKVMDKHATEFTIKVGMTNPIDNSTYVIIEGQESIYHLDAIKNSLEALSASDIIDSSALHFIPQEVQTIEISKGGAQIFYATNNAPTTDANGDTVWSDKSKNPLDQERVETLLQKLSLVKTLVIIDNKEPNILEKIESYKGHPLFEISMTLTSGAQNRFKVSQVVHSIPTIKVEPNSTHLIWDANNKDTPPKLISKEALSALNIISNNFRSVPIKKVFY